MRLTSPLTACDMMPTPMVYSCLNYVTNSWEIPVSVSHHFLGFDVCKQPVNTESKFLHTYNQLQKEQLTLPHKTRYAVICELLLKTYT
jgi:hypothetical protein